MFYFNSAVTGSFYMKHGLGRSFGYIAISEIIHVFFNYMIVKYSLHFFKPKLLPKPCFICIIYPELNCDLPNLGFGGNQFKNPKQKLKFAW